ncbi:PEPxxWA-CTERM sorting domain-containing protein [Phenylobacterium sp.]|uniref:PEPxxWA-CTERM sorting domain-containing protein n=1 Tax=Phenylobacterium sp. TaxID=1871053 RepID=UPI003566D988
MKFRIISSAIAASLLVLGASAANAATGFTLDINTLSNGTPDTPLFTLRNTSDTASLTSFSLNFAPNPNNIDRAISFTRLDDGAPQIQFTVTSPDESDGGTRADGLFMTFTGFDARNPDEGLRFQVDFDPDSSNSSNSDFRNILFNNGAFNNAVLTVGFSDGTTLTQTMPDDAIKTDYVFTGSNAGGVPEPASWALMIAGFGGVGVALRSRRRPAALTA